MYRSNRLDEDWVRCIYCGEHMTDFDDPDFWDVPFEVFERVHKRGIRWLDRHVGAPEESHTRLSGSIVERKKSLYICSRCGWWAAEDRAVLPAVRHQIWVVTLASTAVLKELDLTDIHTPIKDVRSYLMRRFEARQSLHPRLYEQTVASVFRDHGFLADVTAYSNDGGVDIVMIGNQGQRIGVQVKRHSRSIEVEQIRSFLGALILGGYTKGIFVSTTKFQRGAVAAASDSSRNHVPIELIDADRFFDMLRIAQSDNGPDPEKCGIRKDIPLKFHPHCHYHLNSL